MIEIKYTSAIKEWPVIRQTPGSRGVWGNCRFHINDDSDECDWWIVYDGLADRESVRCPKDHTILILGEPPSIKSYNRKFTDQFQYVITCHDLNHPHIISDQQALLWMIGVNILRKERKLDTNNVKNYDDFKSAPRAAKNKIISVITSSKSYTKGHAERLLFTAALKEYFKDRLDVYGGVNDFKDKWDAIAPYQYHIALENSSYQNYWTEKLADCFLGEAYPFYYGCPNIHDYFPDGSLTTIDINNPGGAIEIIERAFAEKTYENSLDGLSVAKNLILDKYNIFAVVHDFVNKDPGLDHQKIKITIEPEKHFSNSLIKKIKSKASRIINRL
jgi:hypothetical protein